MSGDVVERAKALLEGVTEGPWFWNVLADGAEELITESDITTRVLLVRANLTGPTMSMQDAGFIAGARDLVPELVAEVERLRAQIVLTDEQEHQAARFLQDQTAIASIGLCRTFVRGMVKRVNEVREAGL